MPAIGEVHGALGDDGEIGVDARGESLIDADFSGIVCSDGVAAVGSDDVLPEDVRAIVEHVGYVDGGLRVVRVLEQDEGGETTAGETFSEEPGVPR